MRWGRRSHPGRLVVRKRAGRTEDRLEITLHEVLSDVEHEMGEAAPLEKDGVERDLQELLADSPETLGEELRLVRREWPTDIGPVDLMCRDEAGEWVAVEIKRRGEIDRVVVAGCMVQKYGRELADEIEVDEDMVEEEIDLCTVEEWLAHPGTVGRPWPESDVRVIDAPV